MKQLILTALSVALVSCADTDSRYRDTTMLERPPDMQAIHQSAEPNSDEGDENAEPEVKTGLGDKVSLIDSNPPAIRLKQTFDEGWITIGRALAQLELKISDRNREEKVYYVKYDADQYQPENAGLLSMIASSFKNDYGEETYILRVQPYYPDMLITAESARKEERSAGDDIKQNETNNLPDGSSNLLKTLYKTLRDDLKPE